MTGPRAALLAVGNELLAGDIVNGNAAVLGQALAGIGIPVVAQAVVGDDIAAIAAALRSLIAVAEVVVTCGGLGPTQDDVTREGLARAAGIPLDRDEALENQLRQRLGARGHAVPAINLRQADRPRGARALHNPVGTAPGLRLVLGDRLVYALPGVPHELAALLDAEVLADLKASLPALPVVARRTVRTVGLWESAVAEALAPEVTRVAGSPVIAFLASGGQTRVVVTGIGPDLASAEALVAPTVAYARQALGAAVYDADSLEAEVVGLLRARGATVACAESLTAGMVAGTLAAVPGASAVLRGGVVAYATDLKESLLDIPSSELARHGVVSAATAEAMACGVARRCGATHGLALTGVAGPDPLEGHPPGTVFVAVSSPQGPTVASVRLPGDRARIRGYAVTAGLAALRQALLAQPPAGSC